jgi:hypothetical protein
MTDRGSLRLGLTVWALSILLALVGLALMLVYALRHIALDAAGFIGAITLMFSTVGLLVVRAQPRNRVGWILLAIGACYAVLGFGSQYATAAVHAGRVLPGVREILWAGFWMWVPALGMTATFLFLLFPDGHLPSRRWRWVAWPAGFAIGMAALATAIDAGQAVFGSGTREFLRIARSGGASVTPPPLLRGLFAAGVLMAAGCMIASVAATVVRLRGSTGRERQQLQWLVYGAIVLAVGVAASFLQGPLSAALPAFGFTWFVTCVAVAMLRHRLYDIDRIVNRTLVYGAVTILLGAVYAGLAVGLGSAVGSNANSLVIAGSTLVVAALFTPARRRIQAFIDRRFYRRKYDAARTLEAFSARLRDEVDLEELRKHLLTVVGETMQPAHASLWLRGAGAAG